MIVLLSWFHITGLMLLVAAEVNREIEDAGAQNQLKGHSTPAPSVKPAA
jgi:uncharacterized BrkB/YihY/UPF0761 family membrane protein